MFAKSGLYSYVGCCNWGSWGSCSHRCGGGYQSRRGNCGIFGWPWVVKRQYARCNEFCYNRGSFYSGACHCSPWRSGRCCQGLIFIKSILYYDKIWLLSFVILKAFDLLLYSLYVKWRNDVIFIRVRHYFSMIRKTIPLYNVILTEYEFLNVKWPITIDVWLLNSLNTR